MLGIPLHSPHRSSSHHTRRRNAQRRSSSSPVSHRSGPASTGATLSYTPAQRSVRHQRGSSTPNRLDSHDLTLTPTTDNNRRRADSKRTTSTSSTNSGKFNIRSLLARIAAGATGRSSSSPTHCHPGKQLSVSCDRPSMTSLTMTSSSRLTRRSLSQPDHQSTAHNKRSLSASASLRRARITDSTSSISGASTISQYYPSAVAAAAAAHRLDTTNYS